MTSAHRGVSCFVAYSFTAYAGSQVQQCALECDAKGLDHLFSAIVTSANATGDELNPLAAEDIKPLRQHRLTVVETAIQVRSMGAAKLCSTPSSFAALWPILASETITLGAVLRGMSWSCALRRRVVAAQSRPLAQGRCSMYGASSGSWSTSGSRWTLHPHQQLSSQIQMHQWRPPAAHQLLQLPSWSLRWAVLPCKVSCPG
jgi:hypothetical protein